MLSQFTDARGGGESDETEQMISNRKGFQEELQKSFLEVQGRATGWVFLVAGLMITVVASFWWLWTSWTAGNSIRVEGRFVEVALTGSERDGGTLGAVVFTDQRGTVHTQQFSFPAGKPVVSSEVVNLLYPPEHPERARLDSFRGLWFAPVFCLGMGIFLAAFARLWIWVWGWALALWPLVTNRGYYEKILKVVLALPIVAGLACGAVLLWFLTQRHLVKEAVGMGSVGLLGVWWAWLTIHAIQSYREDVREARELEPLSSEEEAEHEDLFRPVVTGVARFWVMLLVSPLAILCLPFTVYLVVLKFWDPYARAIRIRK